MIQHSVTAPDGDCEGAPTIIQEAMAAGAAIVSTRHAGIPGMVDEGDGCAFADRIGALLCDPARARAMGDAARARAVAQFDKAKLHRRVKAVLMGEDSAA